MPFANHVKGLLLPVCLVISSSSIYFLVKYYYREPNLVSDITILITVASVIFFLIRIVRSPVESLGEVIN